MSKPVRKWSPQQAAFLAECMNGTSSIVLEAVAGAGKTTTIIEACQIIRGSSALLSYNKKIADETKAKLEALKVDWKKAQAGTVHSFGFNAWRKFRGSVKVDGDKVRKAIDLYFDNCDPYVAEQFKAYSAEMVKLVSLAKQGALGVVTPRYDDANDWHAIASHHDIFDDESPELVAGVINMAISFFKASVNHLDIIDFDDMIYLPLFYKVRFWQFDNVFVDEAQDTNPARRALVRALVKKGGRVIAVGDRHQAIYGFTGADADSLDLIAKDFSAKYMPLTVTFRCPKSVVEFSKQWVSHITCADTAPEGSVSSIDLDAFVALGKTLGGDDAVLCRLTKPLVSLALQLIRNKIACRIEGRDVAARITKLMKRWKVKSLDALSNKLDDYLARETTKLLAKKMESVLAEVEDLVATCKVIIDQCRSEGKYSISDAVATTESLFGDDVSKILVLSTIHKSKGREWKRVFWLDRAGTCPSKWARQEWQQGQEVNLQYVAATRAMSELYDLIPSAPKVKTNEAKA